MILFMLYMLYVCVCVLKKVYFFSDVSNASRWYTGTIVKKTSRSHQVIYDDGDERAENLKTKKWRFSKSSLLDGPGQ